MNVQPALTTVIQTQPVQTKSAVSHVPATPATPEMEQHVQVKYRLICDTHFREETAKIIIFHISSYINFDTRYLSV